MVEKIPPARPMSKGSLKRKDIVTWGRPLMDILTMIKTRRNRVKPVSVQRRAFMKDWESLGSRRMAYLRRVMKLADKLRIMMMMNRTMPVANRASRWRPEA